MNNESLKKSKIPDNIGAKLFQAWKKCAIIEVDDLFNAIKKFDEKQQDIFSLWSCDQESNSIDNSIIFWFIK